MKTIVGTLALITCGLFPRLLMAQAPEKMSYQAVIRNATNNLISNQPVGIQISILQGSANGTPVYVETQLPTTNANGLVSVEIGTGTVVSGVFSTIDWANGPYFVKNETDPTGGVNYTIVGASQLLSVPYALYAKESGSSIPGPQGPAGINGTDGLSAFEVAVSNGFVGTEAQWLASLVGAQGPAGANGANGAPGSNGTNGVNGLSAYELAVSNGFVGTEAQWLASLVGAQGPAGANGANGTNGTNGAPGLNGANGTNGVNGLSAYELAVSNGFVGTEAQWLASLVGAQGPAGANGANGTNGTNGAPGLNGANGTNGVNGLSAYELAVSNGFVGTEAQWLTSLVGAQGPAGTNGANGTNGTNGAPGLNGSNGTNGVNGLSAYELAVSNGFVGTEAQWLTSLVGAQGPAGANGANGTNGTNGAPGLNGSNGTNGVNGLSAYELAVSNGFVGTEAQWLTSLVGAQGPAGANGANGTNGTNGAPGLNGSNGTNGVNGLSAYELAVSNGYVGTEAQWLTSLVGAQGPAGANGANGTNGTNGASGLNGSNGTNGLSAYELAVSNGFVGTEAQWLTSLVGAQGPAGTNGANGTNGAPGAQGPQGPAGPAGEVGRFYLGKDTLGGIVFCLYRGSDGNQHGLVVSKTETTAFWQSVVSTTNGTRSWDGVFNSALLINSPAMTFVNGLGAGWYLPSIDELSILWQNRFFVNKAMSAGGFTLITSTLSYWSSTEASAANASYFYFVGGQVFTLGKNNNNLVRGVKAF